LSERSVDPAHRGCGVVQLSSCNDFMSASEKLIENSNRCRYFDPSSQFRIEIPGLMDMEQRDTLIAHGKAAMKARIEDLLRRVENSKRTDEQA